MSKNHSAREYYSELKRSTNPTLDLKREERWHVIEQRNEVLSAQKELRHLENKRHERALTDWEAARLAQVKNFIAIQMQDGPIH
jgi:hypothetical protein